MRLTNGHSHQTQMIRIHDVYVKVIITWLIMDEETELGRLQAPTALDDIGRFAPDGVQEGDVRAIEVSQALDVGSEHQGDEVQ